MSIDAIVSATREKVALRQQLATCPRPLMGPTRSGGSMLVSRDSGCPTAWRLTVFAVDGTPYYARWTERGTWQIGWSPSRADMEADDWEVVRDDWDVKALPTS